MLKKPNKAFTLIEMLMVLFIVTLILILCTINVLPMYENVSLTNDIEALSLAIETLQMESLTTNKTSSVQVNSDGFTCFLDEKEEFKYTNEQDYTIITNYENDTIKINDDGNLSRGGDVQYKNEEGQKDLILTIGMGRYEIR